MPVVADGSAARTSAHEYDDWGGSPVEPVSVAGALVPSLDPGAAELLPSSAAVVPDPLIDPELADSVLADPVLSSPAVSEPEPPPESSN